MKSVGAVGPEWVKSEVWVQWALSGKGFGNCSKFILFILYIEFGEFGFQILVSSPDFKNEAHNICPLRNQLKMLFVKIRYG